MVNASESLTLLVDFFCIIVAFAWKTHRFFENIYKRAAEPQCPYRRFLNTEPAPGVLGSLHGDNCKRAESFSPQNDISA
jgi:hypothetical protein